MYTLEQKLEIVRLWYSVRYARQTPTKQQFRGVQNLASGWFLFGTHIFPCFWGRGIRISQLKLPKTSKSIGALRLKIPHDVSLPRHSATPSRVALLWQKSGLLCKSVLFANQNRFLLLIINFGKQIARIYTRVPIFVRAARRALAEPNAAGDSHRGVFSNEVRRLIYWS